MDFVLDAASSAGSGRDREHEDAHVPRWLTVARYAFALLRDFSRGELSLRAMSLVYTTMVAIVPLLAFSFSAMRALGLHREPRAADHGRSWRRSGRARASSPSESSHSVDNVHGSALASVSVACC